MSGTLKIVKVKRTVYTQNKNAASVKQYLDNCISTGSKNELFKDPSIPTASYDLGNGASKEIQIAINAWALAPTKGNLKTITDKMVLGKEWLDSYSDQVDVIANDDANRTTREEASTNILNSYLTPQKLSSASKGKPDAPKVDAENVGVGKVDAQITNGVDYVPSQTTFILVEVAAGAVITFVEGQLMIRLENKGLLVVKAAAQKGTHTHFSGLDKGVDYVLYAYSQNGTKQISELSKPVFVTG